MKSGKYILILVAIVLGTGILKSNPGDDIGKSRPTDSIMNLQYNAATYKSTLEALAKLDKGMAQRLDSAVTLINGLPGCWAMSPVYQSRMYYYRYYQIAPFVALVKKEYEVFEKIEKDYPLNKSYNSGMMEVDKPVIYLYPEKEMDISVNLNFESKDLYTWPAVDDKLGWSINAQPDGMLKDKAGEEYPYLFWETKTEDYSWVNYTEAFVVKAEDTEVFLREKLKYLGLNSREYTDFITFWAPRMRQNKYNMVRFETTAYNKAFPITVTPAPESTQRIMMVYKPLQEPIIKKEQVLKPFTRKGYTLIEWGGIALPEFEY